MNHLPLLGSVAYPLVIADPSSLFGAVLDVLGVVISDNVTCWDETKSEGAWKVAKGRRVRGVVSRFRKSDPVGLFRISP